MPSNNSFEEIRLGDAEDSKRAPSRRQRGVGVGDVFRIFVWVIFLFLAIGEFIARIVIASTGQSSSGQPVPPLTLFLTCFAFDRLIVAAQGK
jgi:hypothetical protein